MKDKSTPIESFPDDEVQVMKYLGTKFISVTFSIPKPQQQFMTQQHVDDVSLHTTIRMALDRLKASCAFYKSDARWLLMRVVPDIHDSVRIETKFYPSEEAVKMVAIHRG